MVAFQTFPGVQTSGSALSPFQSPSSGCEPVMKISCARTGSPRSSEGERAWDVFLVSAGGPCIPHKTHWLPKLQELKLLTWPSRVE